MLASLLAVIVDCGEPRQHAGFWSNVLSYEVVERNVDEFLVRNPARLAAPLYFMRVPEHQTEKNRLHLDLAPIPLS